MICFFAENYLEYFKIFRCGKKRKRWLRSEFQRTLEKEWVDMFTISLLKIFFLVIILVHVVTQQSLHTTSGSQGMFLLLVVSFTPTWHLELCLDENVRLTTISVKKDFQYSSFLHIIILKNHFCSIVNSLMVVKKVICTWTNLQLKASGLIIQSNYLRWRLHLLTTNVNNLNLSNQYFEDMSYFCEKQMWTGFVKA